MTYESLAVLVGMSGYTTVMLTKERCFMDGTGHGHG